MDIEWEPSSVRHDTDTPDFESIRLRLSIHLKHLVQYQPAVRGCQGMEAKNASDSIFIESSMLTHVGTTIRGPILQ